MSTGITVTIFGRNFWSPKLQNFRSPVWYLLQRFGFCVLNFLSFLSVFLSARGTDKKTTSAKIWAIVNEKYRVSHSKDWKVIRLSWGHRFWFLLLFWVLHVHWLSPFMPNSSVLIFLMLRALYRMICKSSKKVLQKRVWM